MRHRRTIRLTDRRSEPHIGIDVHILDGGLGADFFLADRIHFAIGLLAKEIARATTVSIQINTTPKIAQRQNAIGLHFCILALSATAQSYIPKIRHYRYRRKRLPALT